MRSSHDGHQHARSAAGSAGGMPAILYMQDHVIVYTKNDHDALGVWIPGFLAVFSGGMRGEDVPRLCWTSYDKVRQTLGVGMAGEQRQKPLQTMDVPPIPHHLDQFTLKLPLSQCYSIWKHTPDLGRGVPIVRVCLHGGQELPPFLFYHAGVRELFHAVRSLVPLSRDRSDPNLYIVNGDSAGFFPHVSCADEFAPVPVVDDATPGRPVESPRAAAAEAQSQPQPPRPATPPPSSGAFNVFSSVGRLARSAVTMLPGVSVQVHPFDKPPKAQQASVAAANAPPGRATEFATSIGEFHVVDDYKPVDNKDLEALVARPERSAGVDEEAWFMAFDNEGRILQAKRKELRELAFSGGIHPVVRREMWKYLLGYYPWDSTFAERETLRRMRAAEYAGYKTQWETITPLQATHFRKFRERKLAIEKDVMRTDRLEPFFLSRNGTEDTNHYDPVQNPNLGVLHDVLLTYTFFNFDIGYCQGMNDLLAPILAEMQDEADAFWCYKGLMDRMSANFRKDQSGMHAQLRRLQGLVKLMDPELFAYLVSIDADNCHWAFRWVLLHFKRELDYDGTKMVWEAIWSADTEHFHLFIVLAILQTVRDHIMMEKLQFDALLQMCNVMSGRLQYPDLLASATHQYKRWLKAYPDDVRERVLL